MYCSILLLHKIRCVERTQQHFTRLHFRFRRLVSISETCTYVYFDIVKELRVTFGGRNIFYCELS